MILNVDFSLFNSLLILLTGGLILSIILSIYCLHFIQLKKAKIFLALLLITIIWMIFKIISLFITSVETRFYINCFVLATTTWIPILFINLLSNHVTNIKLKIPKKVILIITIITILSSLLSLTSPFHQLYTFNYEIIMYKNIPLHIYTKGIGFSVWIVFGSFLYLLTFGITILEIFNKHKFYRKQLIVLLIGFLIPFLVDMMFVFNISFIKKYNLASVSFVLSNFFIAWSLFGFQFFKLVPIARNLIIEKISDLIFVTNQKDIIVELNPATELFFNFSKKQLIGKSFFEVFGKIPKLINIYNNKTDANLFFCEKSYRTFSVSYTEMLDDNKILLGHIFVFHDISELKKTELLVLEQEQKFRNIFENSTNAILLINAEGKYIKINQAFTNILGYNQIEVQNQEVGSISMHKDDKNEIKIAIKKLINNEITEYTKEIRAAHKNGHLVWCFVNAKKYINQKGEFEYILAEFFDISEIKKNQEFKEKLYSIIAHDLRSPFGSILGFTENLQKNINIYSKDKINNNLQNIYNSSLKAYNLVNSLILWFQTQTNNNLEIFKTKFNIYNEINLILENLNYLFEEKQIIIENNIQKNTFIFVDKDMISIVLRNLIVNATKFNKINGKIILNSIILKNKIKISIQDTGIGISENNISKLFSNLAKEINIVEKGNNLGLMICKEFIEKNEGKISVKSELEKGTEFNIEFNYNKEFESEKNKISSEEKDLLIELHKKLEYLSFFEFSKIRNILQEILKLDIQQINTWCNNLKKSILESNEEKYNNLINQFHKLLEDETK